MVRMVHIKTQRCPTCDNEPVREEIETGCDGEIRTHCNGERWEHRRFRCGFGVEWVPNFSREMPVGECRWDQAARARKSKRETAVAHLHTAIASLDLSDIDSGALFQALNRVAWPRF